MVNTPGEWIEDLKKDLDQQTEWVGEITWESSKNLEKSLSKDRRDSLELKSKIGTDRFNRILYILDLINLKNESSFKKLEAIESTNEYIEIGGVKWGRKPLDEDVLNYAKSNKSSDIFRAVSWNYYKHGFNSGRYWGKIGSDIGDINKELEKTWWKVPVYEDFKKTLNSLPGNEGAKDDIYSWHILIELLGISGNGWANCEENGYEESRYDWSTYLHNTTKLWFLENEIYAKIRSIDSDEGGICFNHQNWPDCAVQICPIMK